MSESRVLLFGEPDADHARTWLHDCHIDLKLGRGLMHLGPHMEPLRPCATHVSRVKVAS
jgi:hypothetical protein